MLPVNPRIGVGVGIGIGVELVALYSSHSTAARHVGAPMVPVDPDSETDPDPEVTG